ncbi:hypothetical protein C7447_104267 [Tenacibaculum adriaticum]|uniref:Phosphoribosylpyrophosphate synthetase n=1 Tax=Tenacibaculum adriaticum TaxID=413713 RepID=A0A5S5DNQ0_9FLAO|nr:hypothetical protein [Tenacibaculum adriaticum]TYP97573.1 hypothetical protein C7447_104267 [Tenacibaculum adriaticum]
MKEQAKNELDYIKLYEKKGYTHSYRVTNGKLKDNNTGESFFAKEVFILAEHRYEGMSNPSDMSILYVIKTHDGNKGTFLAAYGPTADTENAEFFNNIPEENISNSENIVLNDKE